MTIGQKIVILRTTHKYSKEQLAEKLEVSEKLISEWESERSVPEVDKILRLSSLFDVSTDELLKDEMPLAYDYTEHLFKPKQSVVYKGKYFGTDGFRGEANVNLTADHAFKIGRFLGWYYSNVLSGARPNHKTRIAIGKDTRRSSYMFEYAIVAGLISSGADAYMLHVTTTPSVSYVVKQDGLDCGIMISASHNPFYDNGIKLVNRMGEKMDDYTLALIEKYLDGELDEFNLSEEDLPLAKRERIGRIIDHVAGRNRYIGYLISVAANSYKGLTVALDCANGSAWMLAKLVFDALGASTHVINASPDGVNINEQAGSTHISALSKYVKKNHCDVGFAFDGDADRCVAVDSDGNVVNGDHILYVLANRLRRKGLLPGNTVVTTVMSNMGLYRALEEADIGYIKTTVGDRYVYEAMQENDYCIGGEQSGHIIIKKYATTGDGILTAIMLTEEIIDSKLTLKKLSEAVKMYPQTMKNISVSDKSAVIKDKNVKRLIEEISDDLGNNGRILLRESGTEPVVRVMVECDDRKSCDELTSRVAEFIKEQGF